MRTALAPVEAWAQRRAPAPGRLSDVDAERRENAFPRRRQAVAAIGNRQVPARDQRIMQADAEAPGEMIVAGAGPAEVGADPGRQAATGGLASGEDHQPFERRGDLRPGEPVIA